MKDQLNRPITLKAVPKRIVSLVPSQTELLVDLGLEESIVGITKFCVHPAHLRKRKAIVGGTKQVHYEKIKALNPDIILCNKEENTQEMIPALEKIAPVHISDVCTMDDALELILLYGKLFSKEALAEGIFMQITQLSSEFQNFLKGTPERSVAYFIWKEPWMVAAKANFIDELLRLNGFQNYFASLERYPEINLDLQQSESADLVFLSTEPFPFKEEHIEILQPYFPKAKILIVDGEMFSWYGSRLVKAFDYFKMLHRHLS